MRIVPCSAVALGIMAVFAAGSSRVDDDIQPVSTVSGAGGVITIEAGPDAPAPGGDDQRQAG